MSQRSFRSILQTGVPQLGLNMMYPSPGAIERIGPDWDWIWIDGQHGELGYEETLAMVRACDHIERPAFVRVPHHGFGSIGLALDTAPTAIIVPVVDTLEEARLIVKAAKFPPLGGRSYGGRRPIDLAGRLYSDSANDEVLLVVQIESPEAIENADAIAALDGVDALFLGPDDIMLRRGYPMSAPRSEDTLGEDMRAVVAACRKHGKFSVASGGVNARMVRYAADLGFNLIVAGADMRFLDRFREGRQGIAGDCEGAWSVSVELDKELIAGARPFWGDLHNHNGIGYGKGSLERSYEIAHGAGLEVYAFTPHGHWHDLPQDDPKIAAAHEKGFELVRQRWNDVRQRANAENRDGSFASFVAVEWHSSKFGDYHILFPAEEGEVCRAGALEEAQAFARGYGAIMIPHHIAYRQGWRGINWETYRSDVSPVVDVFSEHGNGMETETHWPYVLHSMGGTEKSQTAMEQLRRGRIFGIVASTDNHGAHPACYGEGLVGIWAGKLSRESIFDAIRRRHTYAVTGDRIGLKFHMADGQMGDILPPRQPRQLRWESNTLGALDYVQIIKNGQAVHQFVPQTQTKESDRRYVVRLEFGWDGMNSPEVTDWSIRVTVEGGSLIGIVPCFAGGRGSYEKLNRVKSLTERETVIEAYTARANSRPTSGAVLRLDANYRTLLHVEAAARYRGSSCGCSLQGTIGELLHQTACGEIARMFSAPKIYLGLAHGESETRFAGEWADPSPSQDDFYLVKVQQKNGHIAWSSPIWCTDRTP